MTTRATVTRRCRSLAYGWTVGAVNFHAVHPCAWGGLRAIEREMQRAHAVLGRTPLPGHEALWVGGRRVAELPPGGVAALVDELRSRGRITVAFDDSTPVRFDRALGERRYFEAFRDLDRLLFGDPTGPASIACRLEDARGAWAELRESDYLVRLRSLTSQG